MEDNVLFEDEEQEKPSQNPFLRGFKTFLKHKRQLRQNLTTLDEITPLIIRQICEIKQVKQVKITPIENIKVPAPLIKIDLTEEIINECLNAQNFFKCIFDRIGLKIPKKLEAIFKYPAFFIEFFERIAPATPATTVKQGTNTPSTSKIKHTNKTQKTKAR